MCEDNGPHCTGFEFKADGDTCKLITGPINNKKRADTKMMCYVKLSDKDRNKESKWSENPAAQAI
jgi:hypothetical protein